MQWSLRIQYIIHSNVIYLVGLVADSCMYSVQNVVHTTIRFSASMVLKTS